MQHTAFILGAFLFASSSFISCKNESQNTAPRPNPQTTGPSNQPTTTYLPTTTNQPPLVGVVNAATVTPGQYLTGVLTADDPDRAQGDFISRIEFSTSPEVAGLTNMQVPVGTGDKHSYNILIPGSPNMPSTVGTFTVYDSRGGSSRMSFPITFQGSNGFSLPIPGGTNNTAVYCSALAEAFKVSGVWGVALPAACTLLLPKL